MPHVKDEFILRKIEHRVQGERQFHHSQIGGKMSPVFLDAQHKLVPNLFCRLFQRADLAAFPFICQQIPSPRIVCISYAKVPAFMHSQS